MRGARGPLSATRATSSSACGSRTRRSSAVVELVASSPDLDHVLGRVVDLLTRVSGCHACFVYLVGGDRLRLRAASPVYARQVGRIEFGVDEGLAGWAVRHREAAFIRERAVEDPRTNFIPELEEERFQSMAAVPVPSRGGDVLGVIVLHTAAPARVRRGDPQGAPADGVGHRGSDREREAVRGVPAPRHRPHPAVGAEPADRRGRRSATELYRVATAGVRELLPCDRCRLLELDPAGRLVVVASDPQEDGEAAGFDGTADVLLEMLQSSPSETLRLRSVVGRALGLERPPRRRSPCRSPRARSCWARSWSAPSSRGTSTATSCCAPSPTRSPSR